MPENATAKRRPRFSLQSLLLVITIAAMGIGLWQLYSELAPLRVENQRLRDELGEITISDPTKLHAIRVESGSQLLWKWRVWLPAGRRYKLRCEGGQAEVPSQEFPASGTTISYQTEPGAGEEIWVAYQIEKNPRNGEWFGGVRTSRASGGGDYHPWVDNRGQFCISEGVGDSTRIGEPGKPLLLARWRTADVDNSEDIPDPADGFILWIEPQ